MDANLKSITVVSQFYVYKVFFIFAIMDAKTHANTARQQKKEMEYIHTSLRRKSPELINCSQSLELGKKGSVPTC